MRSTSLFRLSLWLAAAAAFLASSGCMPEATAQGGSDTETLTGLLFTPEGKPAVGARVKLIPSTYNPSLPDTTLIRVAVTSPLGLYTFPKTRAEGSYNLLAAGMTGGAAFLASLSADSVPDTLRLEPPRSIFLRMTGSTYNYDPTQAWFPGTDLFVRCENDSAIAWKGLPRSLNSMVFESSAGWRHDYTFYLPNDSLIITASEYGVDCYPLWSPPQ
ncbi:MAG: hypothetical protein ABIW76_23110 [Fibrobacteria bacterium]